MKRKIVACGMIASLLLGTMSGCGISDKVFDVEMEGAFGKKVDDEEDKFYIYSWNSELQDRLEYVYEVYPELRDKVEYVNVGDSDIYQQRVDRALRVPDAKDYPDMIAFESGYIMKYTNSDYTLPISELGIKDSDLEQMYPYTLEIAEDKRNGEIKGLSWQSCPGAFMYRADLAKTYLGVNSPEEMQAKISNWDDFLATAEQLKAASNDSVRILSSNKDISNVFYSNKSVSWVDDNNNFQMDDTMAEYMEVSKRLEGEDLTWKTDTWTDEWSNGAATDNVFGYFGCTWFLHWTIKANCGATFNEDGSLDTSSSTGTYGKWNMCQGPMPYYWGGTWLGATAECSDKEIAGKIMKALCCDTDVMQKMSEETMDYVNNKAAMQNLSSEGKGTYDFLGGQDFINAFIPLAEEVNVSWMSAYDGKINELLELQLEEFQQGNKTYDDAIADFKKAVADRYPRLNVQ
ncbi:ABC transporter substrate-binding protein [Roseburia sp. 499]|uniref:ABC transporter substrate-binding protein n=1 Tax=Roseburia sp. 499 TaxID=1261634 RepID=UPI0009532491|nr:ABC transporter substrate-binding protein [Roseburia sp. 499]WVK70758.1 ABC transporter substrate-binding protein [Roseburia sp. 499]